MRCRDEGSNLELGGGYVAKARMRLGVVKAEVEAYRGVG